MFEIFGNNAANDTIRWQPEPTTRGTFGILSSCLITISLCIWTAVHLNVPEHNGDFRQLLRKGKWLLIGLLAPELVLFTAWYQNIRAREMEKVVTKHLRKVRRERKALTVAQPPSDNIQTSQQQNEPARVENHDETTSRIKVEKDGTNEDGPDVEQGLGGEDEADKLKWTMKQAFFVNMGGLAFDTREAKGVFLTEDCPPILFFTIEGLEQLCIFHPEVFENITNDKIDDKSKAGGFGKTLVCLQALWFITQCLSRLAQGLPISLLEVFANSPSFRRGRPDWNSSIHQVTIYHQAIAWMCMHSRVMSGARPEIFNIKIRQRDRDLPSPLPSPEPFHMPHGNPTIENLTKSKNACMPTEITLKHGDQFLDTGLMYGNTETYVIPLKPLTLSKTDIRRWMLAAPLIMEESDPMLKGKMIETGRENNWKLPSDLTTTKEFLAWVVLISSSVIYGGLHMLAWNAPFQTKTEQILWRISSPTMMVYGVLLRGFDLWDTYRYGNTGVKLPVKWNGNEKRDFAPFVAKVLMGVIYLFQNFLVVVVSCATLLYLLARIYLVVECFLSLFYSPPGLFRQPNWGPYFPHIS